MDPREAISPCLLHAFAEHTQGRRLTDDFPHFRDNKSKRGWIVTCNGLSSLGGHKHCSGELKFGTRILRVSKAACGGRREICARRSPNNTPAAACRDERFSCGVNVVVVQYISQVALSSTARAFVCYYTCRRACVDGHIYCCCFEERYIMGELRIGGSRRLGLYATSAFVLKEESLVDLRTPDDLKIAQNNTAIESETSFCLHTAQLYH